MNQEITQIVPYLAPAVSGVGDYAAMLARALRDRHAITTRFIVTNPSAENCEPDGFVRQHLTRINGAELTAHLNAAGASNIVILHYAGYGYQQRGCPWWLVRALSHWRRGAPRRRLITMFHELYAFGPMWRSSFWTSPLQRQLVKMLARLSDRCVTNQNISRQWLAQSATDVSVLPVYSTVGEAPASALAAPRREPTMIVFGSAPWRRQAYCDQRGALEAACAALEIRRIVDIGAPCGDKPKLSVPLLETGVIPATTVNQHLTRARAGFFTYPAAYLGKSTIFAAYAAHALVPVTHGGNDVENLDGLRADEHFLVAEKNLGATNANLAAIAGSANAWYRAHNLPRQARHYAELIGALAQPST